MTRRAVCDPSGAEALGIRDGDSSENHLRGGPRQGTEARNSGTRQVELRTTNRF